ncbi:hypothetical protein SESBI_47734 [Sesbania bispinosa]|nr:hypothetical protein SESBI_47734 [Sesbania bispinosa]
MSLCERRGMFYKYPSQNATSRRRNFTRRRLDVYGGLEEKAKDLSEVFRNEFTKKNTEYRGIKCFEKEMDPTKELEVPTKQTLYSEPSIKNLVISGGSEKKIEKIVEEKEAQEESDEAIELTEEDQRNKMDLGICELERNKRLESLIARRKARKHLKLQIENGQIDMKSVTPSQIAPLLVSRANPFDSPKEFEGIEMPGSAPSALRSPFDLPYDPFEEKPILTGDSFDQELKDILLEPRQDLEAKEYPFRLVYPRARRHSGKGNQDRPEQLISKEGSESELAPNPLSEGGETPHEEDVKCKIDMSGMKGEEMDNADATKSMSNHESEPNLIPTITNVEGVSISENMGSSTPKPPEGVLEFPISSTSATNINDSLYESLSTPVAPVHTPSCSLASDLQVEVSEVGSPSMTVDESHETITTTDGESMVYDGDIDKDVTSSSEDMWGASYHSREVCGVSEQDISEANNWRDISSPISLPNIDEENAADVSSMSSRSDMPEDTPTHAMNSDHHNIFGNMKDIVRETGAPQPSHSSNVLSRWKRLMKVMDTHVNHLPQELHSEKPEELCNQSENSINKEQVIIDVNNSAASEQDNTQGSRSNEEPSVSNVQQEPTDEVSNNSSLSSSPRSVLQIPQKTITDQVSSSGYNQEIHLGVEQSNMDVAQETLNGEGSLDSLPQNIQPPMDVPNVESHNSDLSHSQDQSYPPENSIHESNMSSEMNDAEVCNKEDEHKLMNDKNSEDKFTPQNRQNDSVEPPGIADQMTSEDMKEESTELLDDKVPLISLILESSSEVHKENEEKSQASVRQEGTMEPLVNVEATDTSSAKDFEGKHNELNKNEAMPSSSPGEDDKLNEENKVDHSSEEVNHLQSGSKQVVKDHMEKEMLDKCNISKEDSPPPMVTEITNAEGTLGESRMKKNEDTKPELNDNETMVSCESEQVPLISLVQDSSSEVHKENEEKSQASMRQEATPEPSIHVGETDTSSAKGFEGNHIDLNENEAILSSYISAGENEKLSQNNKADQSSEEVDYLQSESKQVVKDHLEKENLDKDDISKNSSLPMVTEVTNAKDTSEESKMNKNEGTGPKLKENEAMVLSEPAGKSGQVNNIAHKNEPEESTSS